MFRLSSNADEFTVTFIIKTTRLRARQEAALGLNIKTASFIETTDLFLFSHAGCVAETAGIYRRRVL